MRPLLEDRGRITESIRIKVTTKNICAMLHIGLGPLVLSATSPYATYAACCNVSNLESIFTVLHVMHTRYSEENSVCPSVCLSVCLSDA